MWYMRRCFLPRLWSCWPVPCLHLAVATAALRGFTMAGLIYGFGGMALTMAINVPLNQALALIETPLAPAQANAVRSAYSETWQFWNIIRPCATAVALLLTGLGLLKLTQTGRDSVNA